MIVHLTRPSVLCIIALLFKFKKIHAIIITMNAYFFKICNTHTHTWLCIDRLYFIWGGKILRKVESLMIILLYSSLAYFSRPSSRGLTKLLWSSRTETFNKNFGINCFLELPSTETSIFLISLLEWPPWPHIMLIIGWWSYKPRT